MTGVNRVSALRNGQVETYELDPEAVGIPRGSLERLTGGTPEENARITLDILRGHDRGPRRSIVLLNAAGVLSLESGDWEQGLATAEESLDSGAALETLERWIERTRTYAH